MILWPELEQDNTDGNVLGFFPIGEARLAEIGHVCRSYLHFSNLAVSMQTQQESRS